MTKWLIYVELGWMHIKGQQTFYYEMPKDDSDNEPKWPPKYWKFTMETTPGSGQDKVEAAFTDARRFARIRLVHCEAKEIRNTTPLKENGPDPVVDKDIFTLEFFEDLMNRKKVPVKALLLDQANISGIGNWVGDEIMYHAKLHPEQYSNTFSSDQLKQLHTSIRYVCQTAVDLLSDSSKFPDDWLFKYRWGKGKKDKVMSLPNGQKIAFLKVGGRTSCVVPSVQKKTGVVAGDIKNREEEEGESEGEGQELDSNAGRKAKATRAKKGTKADDAPEVSVRPRRKKKAVRSGGEETPELEEGGGSGEGQEQEQEQEEEEEVVEEAEVVAKKPKGRKRKAESQPMASERSKKAKKGQKAADEHVGRRRSGRVGK